MLKKLIKHELFADIRSMWPIYGAVMLLTLMTRFGLLGPTGSLLDKAGFFGGMAKILLWMGFGLGIAVLLLSPLVMNIVRFRKTVLRDEGYLTMTLPVSTHELILSKLICGIVLYLASGLLLLIVILFFAEPIGIEFSDFFEFFGELWENARELMQQKKGILPHGILICTEALLLYAAAVCSSMLMFFAAFSMGHTANKKKNLLSVLLCYGFGQLSSSVGARIFLVLADMLDKDYIFSELGDYFREIEMFLSFNLIFMLLLGGGFYALTYYYMTHKLNLE